MQLSSFKICLQSEGEVNHDNFEITFDYSFLAPPVEDLPGYAQKSYINQDSTLENVWSIIYLRV